LGITPGWQTQQRQRLCQDTIWIITTNLNSPKPVFAFKISLPNFPTPIALSISDVSSSSAIKILSFLI